MAEVIKMPKLSDTMTEGVIAAWQKKVGEKVSSGDVLAEIESDKATLEFESFHDGVVLHIEVDAGKSTEVDNVIAIIGEEGEDFAAILKEAKEAFTKESAEPTESKPAPKTEAPKAVVQSAPRAEKTAQPRPLAKEAPTAASNDDRTKISPLAKKLAEERGVSLRAVRGSGENGRIVNATSKILAELVLSLK
jgi:pyruvate dehydrogenase E2 component (dihydrolipoamide acetyltransferase)